ncbi:MAG TPA: SRPBCC family protein [Candidatus Dormibacteraeota bacterium]|nr:SRPBCC family protein [Candidatus Dormibacteraeota bacterium]
MTQVVAEVSIAAAPDVVWHAVHEDLAGAPRWAAYLRSAEALDGPPGPDSRVRYDLELGGGFLVELILQYTTWDRPRLAAGRFAGGPLQGTWSYRYVERAGATDLRYEMDYELRGLLRFAGGMLKGQYEEGIRRGMTMLKEHLESTAGKGRRARAGPASPPGRAGRGSARGRTRQQP